MSSFLAPFALSLSKGRVFLSGVAVAGQGFDKLSPNGVEVSF